MQIQIYFYPSYYMLWIFTHAEPWFLSILKSSALSQNHIFIPLFFYSVTPISYMLNFLILSYFFLNVVSIVYAFDSQWLIWDNFFKSFFTWQIFFLSLSHLLIHWIYLFKNLTIIYLISQLFELFGSLSNISNYFYSVLFTFDF